MNIKTAINYGLEVFVMTTWFVIFCHSEHTFWICHSDKISFVVDLSLMVVLSELNISRASFDDRTGSAPRLRDRRSADRRACIRQLPYNVVVVDEAHERSLNFELFPGALPGLLQNPALRAVITSATINSVRFEAFCAAHGIATQTVSAPRCFPVHIIHGVGAPSSTLQAVVAAVLRPHCSRQADNDVLGFLDGADEIEMCCTLLAHEAEHTHTEAELMIVPLNSAIQRDVRQTVFHRHCRSPGRSLRDHRRDTHHRPRDQLRR